MKSALALSVILLAAACGTANNSSVSSSGNEESQATSELKPVAAEIQSVQVKSANAPAMGMWTEITVGFTIPCHQTLEHAALSYARKADGKIEVLSSAYVSSSKVQFDMVCQAFSTETRTISVAGIATDVSVVNLTAPAKDIPVGTADIQAVHEMEIKATRPLCPLNSICKDNGTVVTLALTMGSCVNHLGPVAFHADIKEDNTVALYVNAVEFVDERAPLVRCSSVTGEYELTIRNVIAHKDSIELINVK